MPLIDPEGNVYIYDKHSGMYYNDTKDQYYLYKYDLFFDRKDDEEEGVYIDENGETEYYRDPDLIYVYDGDYFVDGEGDFYNPTEDNDYYYSKKKDLYFDPEDLGFYTYDEDTGEYDAVDEY